MRSTIKNHATEAHHGLAPAVAITAEPAGEAAEEEYDQVMTSIVPSDMARSRRPRRPPKRPRGPDQSIFQAASPCRSAEKGGAPLPLLPQGEKGRGHFFVSSIGTTFNGVHRARRK